jgi:hypothetical protein
LEGVLESHKVVLSSDGLLKLEKHYENEGKEEISHAWPDLQEVGLNISLH